MKDFSVKEICLILFLVLAFAGFLYDNATSGNLIDPMIVIGTIFFEIIFFFIARKVLIDKMKNVRHATNAANYMKEDSLNLTTNRDEFVVYKRWKENNLEETSDDPNKGDF
ncbi:MAG: hypothetical protein IKE46_04220 [Selenomonadaceae bacterium]|nr:hypothetical protein [Selenomonadaceae bacterium]MBR3746413.1 hypothetical protein [Selenomonadaceae bacterium]